MGFVVTTPTDIPSAGNGSFDLETWGEINAPYLAPATIGPGVTGGAAAFAHEFNYPLWHGARWSRAMVNQTVMAEEGLFASCVVKQGVFNVAAATLDIELTTTRLVVDVNGDGGPVLELIASPASPETLAPLTDNYVDIKEDGTVTVVSVVNAAPEPGVTADSVRVYVLVTDATQLDSATLASGIAPFPCLAAVGAVSINAGAIVTGTLDVEDSMAELPLEDRGALVANKAGVIRNNETFFSSTLDGTRIQTISEPRRGPAPASLTTGATLASTGAITVRRIQLAEPVWITVSMRYSHDTNLSLVNVGVHAVAATVGGPGTVIGQTTFEAVTAGSFYSATFPILWIPNLLAIDTDDYTFTVQVGTGSFNTTCTHITLDVAAGFQV